MTRWVLLRGLAREAGHWGRFPDALARATGDPVLTHELPGNGARWAERSPLSLACYVEDCRRRIPTSRQPTVLLAMSLGAMVAMEWSRQAPHELGGCVLVNTSTGGSSPFWRRLQPRSYGPLARALLAGSAVQSREATVLAMTSRSPPDIGLLEHWVLLARSHPVSTANALRQLWTAARYTGPQRRPPVPLLLLASAGDRLVHPSCSDRLSRRWEVPLQMHPWGGHDLPLDDPQWVIQRVLDWRRELPVSHS